MARIEAPLRGRLVSQAVARHAGCPCRGLRRACETGQRRARHHVDPYPSTTRQPGPLRARFHFGLPAPFTRPELAQVQRLVFVCFANLNRSALAQALCEQAGVPAASFGLYTLTGGRTFSASMRVAADMGCRLEPHRATHWKDFERRPGDLYLAMEPEQAQALVRLGIAPRHVALLGHWARPRRLRIRDPYLKSERELRRCFEQVRTAVAQLVAELRAGQRAPCHAAGQGRCAAAADGADGAEAEPAAA